MYQNKLKIRVNLILFTLLFIPFAICALYTIFNVFLIVTNRIHIREEGYSITGILFAVFIFLSIVFFRGIMRAFRARKMGCFFEKDEDGLIAVEELAAYMHMKQQRCLSFFLDCVGKGFLRNCMIFPEDPTYILLDNGKDVISEKYVVQHCHNCGAPNTLRIGFESACKYCGQQILNK